MASLGQELKRERELRAVSLTDIANSTKINSRYLRALEEDRWDLLPGVFFIKGVIRAYAKCIGLDENSLVNKYHEEVLLQEDAREKSQAGDEPFPLAAPKKRWGLWILLAATLAAALLAVYFLFIKPLTKSPSSVQGLAFNSSERIRHG
jgi:cytoskeletal protein RodZ